MRRIGAYSTVKLLAAALAIVSATSGCDPTGVSSFENSLVVPPSLATTKAWRDPMLLDDASLGGNPNFDDSLGIAYYSSPTIVESGGVYLATFTYKTISDTFKLYGTFVRGASADTAVVLDGAFTRSGKASAFATSDGCWNVTFTSRTATDNIRPRFVEKCGAAWSSAVDLTAPDDTTGNGAATDNTRHTLSTGVDATGNFVFLWADAGNALHNVYKPFRWSYGLSAGPTVLSRKVNGLETVNDALIMDTSVAGGVGSDVAFDSNGNGVASYIDQSGAVYVSTWTGSGASFAASSSVVAAGATAREWPRLYVSPDGTEELLFYYSSDAMTTTLQSYDLSAHVGPLALGNNVVRLSGNDAVRPIVRRRGDYAVVGTIARQGALMHPGLYLSRREGTGIWTELPVVLPLDGGLNWADADINSSGDIVAVVSGSNLAEPNVEHVMALIWSGGAWQSVKQLDHPSFVVAHDPTDSAYPGFARPSVAISEDGTALAAFTMYGTTGKRRVIAIPYR